MSVFVAVVPFSALTVIVLVVTASTGTSLCLPLVPIGSVSRGYDLIAAEPVAPPKLQLNCNDSLAILTVDCAKETLFDAAVTYVCASVLVEGQAFKT